MDRKKRSDFQCWISLSISFKLTNIIRKFFLGILSDIITSYPILFYPILSYSSWSHSNVLIPTHNKILGKDSQYINIHIQMTHCRILHKKLTPYLI